MTLARTERRTSVYLPPEGNDATTLGCDGYALRKIITDFLLPRMPCLSPDLKDQITAILDDMLEGRAGTSFATQAVEENQKDDQKKGQVGEVT